MNKFVTGALALAAAGTVSHADPGGDGGWLELDSEISSLASSLSSQGGGGGWSALLRSTYNFSSDQLATGSPTDPDISGFSLDDVDVALWGEVGDYGYRVSFDLGSGSANLEDAFAWWACGDMVTAQMGQYKANVFRSNYVNPENTVAIDRTVLGSAFDGWDTGVGASGEYDQFGWNVDIQNGSNGQDSDHRWIFRGEYDLGGGAGDVEGALGGNDDLNATAGLVYLFDDTITGMDRTLIGADFNGHSGPIGFGAEVAKIDADLANNLNTGGDFLRLGSGVGNLSFADGTNDPTVFALTGSYLINEEFEAVARYQDMDNFDDNALITLGINWYQSGHNAKWQANVTQIDSNVDDTTVFQVGLVVGSTD
jgi:hypothetical protein